MGMATYISHPLSHPPTPTTTTLGRPALASPLCIHITRASANGGKVARNVIAMATGDASTEAVASKVESPPPEALKDLQEAWDKVEDKYAVTSLAVALAVALWASTGMISAIDRLPIIPGVLELVGIGYTAWFVYQNLIYEPQREALLEKIKGTYKDIAGN